MLDKSGYTSQDLGEISEDQEQYQKFIPRDTLKLSENTPLMDRRSFQVDEMDMDNESLTAFNNDK